MYGYKTAFLSKSTMKLRATPKQRVSPTPEIELRVSPMLEFVLQVS